MELNMSALKKAVFPVILLVALAGLITRMNSGIWDPWEMDRAHVSRQLAGRAKVLIVENDGDLFDALEEFYGEEYFLVGVDGAKMGTAAKAKGARKALPTRETRLLKIARSRLEAEIFHGLYVEASILAARPAMGLEFLETAREENPGALVRLFADSAEECDGAISTLEQAMVVEAAELLRNGFVLVDPETDIEALAAQRAGSHPFVVKLDGCIAGGADELGAGFNELDSRKWTRVVYKAAVAPKTKKNSKPALAAYSAPPLDYWLTALSYKAFGFSETSSRLPFVVLGFVLLLAFAWLVRRLFDSGTAVLATLVLISIPMFFGQAKNMSGEVLYSLTLTAAVLLFALNIKEGFSLSRLLGIVVLSLVLFLGKGLFGMAALLLVCGSYIIVVRDFRLKAVVLPVGLMGLLFGILVLLVQLPAEWTFFTHFKFMNRPFNGGPVEEHRTYEFLVRHVAFGLLPWTLVLPFAIARLLPTEERTNGEAQVVGRVKVLVALWFAVPFVWHSALMPGFLHMMFPAAAAVALAVALMWREESQDGPSRLRAFVVAGIAAVLLANLFSSPGPLLSYLTLDPEFGGEKGLPFPDDFTLTMVGKGLLALCAALLFYFYARGGNIIRKVVAFFRRRVPFWAGLWVCAVIFVIRLVAGMASRFSMALGKKEASALDPLVAQQYNELFGLRIESFVLYGAALAVAVLALLRFTPAGPFLKRKLRLLAPVGRGIAVIGRFTASDLFGLLPALVLALAGLVDILVSFDLPEGSGSAVAGSPSALAAAIVALAGIGGALAARFLVPRFSPRSFSWRAAGRLATGTIVVAIWILTSAVFRQTDLGALDVWALTMASFFLLGLYIVDRVLKDPLLFHLTAWGILAAVFLNFLAPLAMRWPYVEAIVFPRGQVKYLHYLLLESRVTWLPAILIFLLVGVYLFPKVARLCRSVRPLGGIADRMGPWNPVHWPEALQQTRVFIPVMLVAAVAFGLFYAVHLLPGFSREVSQKHILELYYSAEDRSDLGDDMFKYQKSAEKSREDTNFYTAQIPALSTQQDLTAVLLGQKDSLVKVTRSSSHPGPELVLVEGFDPANDEDGDGVRDRRADSGVLSSVGDRTVVDERKDWETDQWKEYLLVDWRGNTYEILGNDATSLSLSLTPPIRMGRKEQARYVIDHPEARNHGASARSLKRRYVVLSQEAFSTVNFSFRSKSDGMHIPVLDGSNINFLLAAGFLLEGEKNHNRFANATFPQDKMERLMEWTASPAGTSFESVGVDEELGENGRMRSGYINFNDQVKFLGYQMKTSSPARGDKLNLRLFFECTGKVTTSWKIFIHMDSAAASNRIHGDHWPLNMSKDPEEKKCVGCWRTNHWMKGDVVLDDFQTEVPMGSPSGMYNIYMGFYTPGSDKRLKVKDFEKKKIRHDGKNRVFIGTFEVH